MSKKLGYSLVSFSLLTGTMVLSEAGNAVIIANSTGGDIKITAKGMEDIVIKKDARSPDLKVKKNITITGAKAAVALKALKIKNVGKDAKVLTIVIRGNALQLEPLVKAKK